MYLKKLNLIVLMLLAFELYSCKRDFLEIDPFGSTSGNTLANKAGVNGLLTGAYAMLDGWGGTNFGGGTYPQAVSNWYWGGIASDEAHKGSTDGDGPDIAQIENYTVNPTLGAVMGKWGALYAGIQRANDVIRTLALVNDNSLSQSESVEIRAEATFLRAFFHFEAAKIWRNVPYVDETVSYGSGNYNVPNTEMIWPKIEKDFQFAVDNLPNNQGDASRPNSWAAKAFLAKVYMFQNKFKEADSLFDDIIANGVTSSGQKYNLRPNYVDNFNPETKNHSESIFAVQMTVHDGANGLNGNPGFELAFPIGGPTTCCGFYQPSFSLVNSYKTDEIAGLPLLDTWNDNDMKNDEGLESSDDFTPYVGTVDPRLDWTVCRRGIPFFDWGIMPGKSYIREQDKGGPYFYKKNQVSKSQQPTFTENGAGWNPHAATAINYIVIRFSDVLLLAAEAKVELNDLGGAEELVNRVRKRSANPQYWVHTYLDPNDPSKGFSNTPAANYKIGLYPDGYFLQQGQDLARKAVRFERKIELAMEGYRFFDLQRWDNGTGYMADVINTYIQHELNVVNFDNTILKGANFVKGKNELFPIPQRQIDLSVRNGVPALNQNPNY